MLHRSVKTARMCGVGIALSSLLSGGAYAADLLTKAPPVPYAAADDFWTRPYLFGDLGRTELKEQGIDLGLTLGDEALRKTLFDPIITEHRGRIVKNTGDGAVVEFASVVDTVRCAVEVQRGVAKRNTDVPQVKRIEFRKPDGATTSHAVRWSQQIRRAVGSVAALPLCRMICRDVWKLLRHRQESCQIERIFKGHSLTHAAV